MNHEIEDSLFDLLPENDLRRRLWEKALVLYRGEKLQHAWDILLRAPVGSGSYTENWFYERVENSREFSSSVPHPVPGDGRRGKQ